MITQLIITGAAFLIFIQLEKALFKIFTATKIKYVSKMSKATLTEIKGV